MKNITDNDHPGELKGMIQFSCRCDEKILVFEGAAGRTSNKCPRCGKITVFNYDTMSAIPAAPLKGAVHKLRTA